MNRIASLRARQILDSRGNPTLEVEATLESGRMGRAAVPSGASTGSREALELRDGGERYHGKSVGRAVAHVNGEIASVLRGREVDGLAEQASLDRSLVELDGTSAKSRLGANALLGVSLALAHVAAAEREQPLYRWLADGREPTLPLAMMNVINGGAHASNSVDFQEFMLLPVGAPSFSESLRYGVEVFHVLRETLHEAGLNTNVGDEGGFAPDLESNDRAIELLLRAIERAGFRPGEDLAVGLDVAASEFFEVDRYALRGEGVELGRDELIRRYEDWLERYPLVTIEDGLAEGDWDGWKELTLALGDRCQLVGDDLFVTDPNTLAEGVSRGVANAVLLKVNQIGTLSETLETLRVAESAKYGTVVSHRSGETEDTTIADLAAGRAAGQIKTGSLSRSDRVAKYNQLLRIEEDLAAPVFAGRGALAPGR